jgi:putative addiction module killer protein
VAQPGSALAWGARGRRFESFHTDHESNKAFKKQFLEAFLLAHSCILWDTITAIYSILTTPTFNDWFAGLKDRLVKQRIQARIDRVEDGNLGDHKPVGEGVSELRLSFGAGWRIYYSLHGLEIVVLLAGGNKSNQQSDIEQAKALAKQLKG